jgi:hypothetical protein
MRQDYRELGIVLQYFGRQAQLKLFLFISLQLGFSLE